MEDSGFCSRANDRRLLVRFPGSRLVLLPAAPLPRSALNLPEEPCTCPKTCPQESHLKTAAPTSCAGDARVPLPVGLPLCAGCTSESWCDATPGEGAFG